VNGLALHRESFAKNAAASLKKSRSWRTRANSRRNYRSSSSSAEERPWPGVGSRRIRLHLLPPKPQHTRADIQVARHFRHAPALFGSQPHRFQLKLATEPSSRVAHEHTSSSNLRRSDAPTDYSSLRVGPHYTPAGYELLAKTVIEHIAILERPLRVMARWLTRMRV
jgi:hypothetical protein